MFLLQALLKTDRVALTAMKEILDQFQMGLVLGALGLWFMIRKEHSADCVPAHSQQFADLPDFDILLMHLTDGFSDLRREHGRFLCLLRRQCRP